MLAGLTNSGRPSSSANVAGRPGVISWARNGSVAGLGDAVGRQHLLGHGLVHRRARSRARRIRRTGCWPARAGPARFRLRPSGRAAAARRRCVLVPEITSAGMIEVPVGSRWPGSAVGPAAKRGSCTLGDRPRAIAGDADRRDLVLGGIGGAQHVCGSGATDVVFGRLAAEQHHQPDSIACSHAAPTVPCAAMRFRASDVAAATGGRLVGPDVDIDGAGFDTRTLRPGQLFVPLVAERDGHDFIDDALAAGAAAYLTSRPAGRWHGDRGRRHAAGVDGLSPRTGAVRSPARSSASPGRSARPARRTWRGQRWQPVVARRRTSAASTTSRACRRRSSTRPTTPR